MHPAPGQQPGQPPAGFAPGQTGFGPTHPGFAPAPGPYPPGPAGFSPDGPQFPAGFSPAGPPFPAGPPQGHFSPPGGQSAAGPAGSSPSLPLLAGLAAVVLVAVGLSIPFDSSSAWSTQTAWAIFAIVAALLVVAPFLLRASAGSPRMLWFTGVAGAVGVLGYWLLIVLPGVSSNQGFVLTLGAALAACSCWFSPHRPR